MDTAQDSNSLSSQSTVLLCDQGLAELLQIAAKLLEANNCNHPNLETAQEQERVSILQLGLSWWG